MKPEQIKTLEHNTANEKMDEEKSKGHEKF